MKKIKKILVIILACLFGLTYFVSVPTHATSICDYKESELESKGISKSVWEASGCNGNTDAVKDIVLKILQAVIAITGLVAVVFIVIGGINYMTSTGDPGKVEKAKKTILYALIGLVICALAFAIVNWTIGVVNGSSKVGKATDYSSKETCEKAGHTWGKADDKATKDTCY